MTELEKVPFDMKLEVVLLGVSDVDRAKAFYENLGWRLDIDIARDPEGRSYFSFASFEDPDGNSWLLQEITTRLPGREWKSTRVRAMDAGTLAELLRETGEHHDHFEKTHAEHHWWDWYAPYLSARQNGSDPEGAAAAADRHMEDVLHILAR